MLSDHFKTFLSLSICTFSNSLRLFQVLKIPLFLNSERSASPFTPSSYFICKINLLTTSIDFSLGNSISYIFLSLYKNTKSSTSFPVQLTRFCFLPEYLRLFSDSHRKERLYSYLSQ